MVDIDALKGMPDVEFDFAVSAELKRVFRAAAVQLSGQRGSRAAWRTTGSTDFKGHFSTVFTQNGQQQLSDLDEIVTALGEVATKVETVEQAAREENQRRKAAREWAQRQDDRNWFQERWDDTFGGEDPPSTDFSDSGPSTTVPAARPATRQTPPPGGGGGGGGGGTSSARPSNLRSFATSTTGGDTELSTTPGRLQTQCDNFATSCSWATLDASGPISGEKEWLRLNGEDAKWATTVADAFEKAGGEHNVSTLSNASIAAALAAAHVAVNRTDIQVDPPTAYGSPPTTGYSNDPVNTASGNFIENEIDLEFGGLSGLLSLTRSYNSMNSGVGALGPGWSSWAEAGLSFGAEAARLRLADGREIVFPRLGDAWDRARGENLWLERTGENGFQVSNASGLRWQIGLDGRIRSTWSGPGTAITLDYDDAGRLVRLRHQFGRFVELVWDEAHPRIAAASASDGRRAVYHYDDQGRLYAVDTPAGTRRYRWNDADLIDAVIDADGVVEAENSYDDQGRVTQQRSPQGRVTRFAYLGHGITSVSDADGTRANTWISDTRGRLIGVIDSDDQRQSTSYDAYGNPVLLTERDGSTTVNLYDERGRRVEQVLPSGARVKQSFDDADRLLEQTITTSDGSDVVEAVNRYRYDGDSRDPAQLTDPEGGVTAMVWVDGLLKQITDPEGVTLHFEHDAYGDLVATTDADGNTARLERDALGRIVTATTPLGHATTYRYDGAGPLQSRQDPDGAIWRYEHTAGGRIRAVVDPMGGRTEIEHSLGAGGTGEQARTIDPLGRAVSSTYDDLGNRVRAELPDGSTWAFGYDALSRLTTVTDPTGARSELAYDSRGFVQRSTDPTGVEIQTERNRFGQPTQIGDRLAQTTTDYDALGRIVAQAGPDGTVAHSRYDRCGRLVEQRDPTGATTRIERDRAGRPVRITHPMGTTYGYAYDRCGRRVTTIDTDGSRYELMLDADGRLVGENWPTGEHVWLRYDECGRLVERYEPGQGTSSWAHDKVGRVVRTSDGWHGRRRFRYDAAGQLVGVTNAAGGETKFDYDDLGRCTSIVDPLGGRTVREFDGAGRLVAETDPLGRTTRYGYDAAGRQTRKLDPTGAELSWRYDETGRLSQTLAEDRLIGTYERDFAARVLRVRDGEVLHELAYDPNGQLIRRMRRRFPEPVDGPGGTGLSWSYDGDGRRVSFTRTDGSQTRYEYDLAGRVAALTEPGLGRAVIERDAIGRIVSMVGPGLHATWTWDGGAVVRHVVTREGVAESTEIERDEAGRVVAQTTNGVRTAYGYDEAGQLIEARRGDGSVTTYRYDAGGRLVRETTDDQETAYRYDAAGQLLSRATAAGVTEFGYDAAGRRIREIGPEGERRFGWDPRGFLDQITSVGRAGDKITARSQQFRVDALGELASIDGQAVSWDSAASTPALAQIGEFSISSYGPLTALLPDGRGALSGSGGDAAQWLTPGWRPRAVEADPWGVSAVPATPELPSGVQIGGHGSLLVDGLEWMQARVYDPSSRGFLSTDPMAPVVGSGWSGNPYAFAGNDPLNRSDPWGLRPVTDQELQAYRDANNGFVSNAWNAATSWVKDNWEYIAAGAMIVAGVALMCTGIGGPAGVALMMGSGALLSAGASVVMQKATTGGVDWGQVGTEALMGAIPIPGAGAVGGVGRTVVKEGLETGARAAAREGAETAAVSATRTTARDLESTCVRGACFTAGTAVLMGDGSSVNIEDVRVGDEVVATDPETGETHGRRVVETYLRDQVPTYDVETTTGRVTSTAEHPFYVRGRGWTPVRELRVGDELVDAKGRDVQVRSVEPTGVTATVYNFHVDDLHTYHVEAGDAWILVHNECQVLDPNTVRFSQNTMGETSAHVAAARAGESRAVDVVRMPDNALTTVDNRTVAAARETGTDVSARVHGHTDQLPAEHVDRFLGRKGEVPQTWGDAVTNRVGNQSAAFRNENPYGSYEVPRVSGGGG